MGRRLQEKGIDFLLRYRYLLALVSIVATVLLSWPMQNLYFELDYKIYFEESDANLNAYESIEDQYTKTDNLAIILQPRDKNIFSQRNLAIIHEITELGWQTPYVIRVDSLTNFQHVWTIGDDLIVEDLVLDPDSLSLEKVESIKSVALSEKTLVNRIVSINGDTTLINIVVELPDEVDPHASSKIQQLQRAERDGSHLEIVEFGREIVAQFEQRYPDIEMHLGGVSVMNNSFQESTVSDLQSLIPIMYLMIAVALALFLRSFGSVVAAVLMIAFASAVGIGSAAWLGYSLNTVNIITPTVILTIAVCDSVHLLVVYLSGLDRQMTPVDAMRESLRLNFQPIILTSVTTAVGFFTLNFSISPPFQQFGNMTATGVLWAMLLSFTLFPAITVLLVRKHKKKESSNGLLTKYADFIIRKRKEVLLYALIVAIALIAFIPLNTIDDDPISYFKQGMPFRDTIDFMSENLPGVKDINFSLECGTPNCINNIDFLNKLDEFETWLGQQPQVVYVSSYANVIKRLNKSINRDDESYYQIPLDSDLSAQYNLLYEMSLPIGLDLNNQINFNKSSTLVTVLAQRMTTLDLINLELSGHKWVADNYPEIMSIGSSVSLIFAHLGVNNIKSMFLGIFFAIIGITITIMFALRSVGYGLVSMIPNVLPALVAFGVWGILNGQVNMAVAGVFSISLGILVDDSVHFISKYRYARLVEYLSPEEAIHYAFSKVGSALIVTTLVLILGFSILMVSSFNLNAMLGALTAITIGVALIFDFLLLPPLLMMFDSGTENSLN